MEMSEAVEGCGVLAAPLLLHIRLILRYIAHSSDSSTCRGNCMVFPRSQRFLPKCFCCDLILCFSSLACSYLAYFEVASVANFSELVAGIAKMFVNQSQELFADVCANVLAERWIKPYNISRSTLL